MDPISLILGALTEGATHGIADSLADAVKDAYFKLKQLISSRFASNSAAEIALREHDGDPATWQEPLAKALIESGAGADPEVIRAAQLLMALLDETGTRAGKYQVDLRGASGVQIGDRNQQVNIFNSAPRPNDERR
jgi:hypothetical protein